MGNIATPNIIKASDIMDLTNNSLTTGNIYASGTSATIGTSDNPFDKVYANTYYGGFKTVPLMGFCRIPDSNDFNSVTSTGIYKLYGASNSPNSNYYTWWYLINIQLDNTYNVQIAFYFWDTLIYTRLCKNGTYTSWIQIATV